MRLPYGISNFEKIIRERLLYIDRTEQLRRVERLSLCADARCGADLQSDPGPVLSQASGGALHLSAQDARQQPGHGPQPHRLVKTAFLTVLFDDNGYIMDSETSIGRGYCDLLMIVRPDARQYAFLDHVIEFKHLKLSDLPGVDSEALRGLSREALRARPEIAALLGEAGAQLARYRETLVGIYGERLRLRTHAVVCIGLLRFVW